MCIRDSLGAFTATAEDALTVRITSERETHIMDSVLAEWVFAIYHVGADGSLVYTGPYAPAEFVAGSHIDFPTAASVASPVVVVSANTSEFMQNMVREQGACDAKLRAEGGAWTAYTCERAAEGGHLEAGDRHARCRAGESCSAHQLRAQHWL